MNELVLSLFPGIGILDEGFEENGFCVVRGPDLLWGGDIKDFHPPAGRFEGVIGGPPCQRFSSLQRINVARGMELPPNLIPEFERCVVEAQPAWFLMENVPLAPVPIVAGYIVQDQLVDNWWLGERQGRLRRWSWGTLDGQPLRVQLSALHPSQREPTVTRRATKWENRDGHGKRPRPRSTISWPNLRESLILQGLPGDYLDRSGFTVEGAQAAVGNAVPLPMARAPARAVREVLSRDAGSSEAA